MCNTQGCQGRSVFDTKAKVTKVTYRQGKIRHSQTHGKHPASLQLRLQ